MHIEFEHNEGLEILTSQCKFPSVPRQGEFVELLAKGSKFTSLFEVISVCYKMNKCGYSRQYKAVLYVKT